LKGSTGYDARMNRRDFVRTVPTLGAFTLYGQSEARAQASDAAAWPAPPPAPGAPKDQSFPSHHPFVAKEMVGVAHGNIARVKELLAMHPSLAKASWDWGFGDWETALGAASHVGNRAIAELLLEHGAGPTIFSAAMLGQLDVVKAFAAAVPDVNQQRGPHGLPLINHARAGGAPAAAVVKYLESLGNLPAVGDLEPLSDADRASIEGRYVFGNGPRDQFIVDFDKKLLGITRTGGSKRNLTHRGKLEFYPVGAPAVRIRFERTNAGMELTVLDPDVVVRGRRTD
jgi:hypothetical protein